MRTLSVPEIIAITDPMLIKLISLGKSTANTMDSMFLYLDPASGSVIAQMVIAALVGVGITFKVFWYKIKSKLSRST